jgi:hypothetical protein
VVPAQRVDEVDLSRQQYPDCPLLNRQERSPKEKNGPARLGCFREGAISKMKMSAEDVAEIEQRLLIESFGSLRLHFLNVSPDKNYDFASFFDDVRDGILKYHPGVGDVIHSVIMKNNGVDHILTFDEKDDFKQIPGLTVFHPKDF